MAWSLERAELEHYLECNCVHLSKEERAACIKTWRSAWDAGYQMGCCNCSAFRHLFRAAIDQIKGGLPLDIDDMCKYANDNYSASHTWEYYRPDAAIAAAGALEYMKEKHVQGKH